MGRLALLYGAVGVALSVMAVCLASELWNLHSWTHWTFAAKTLGLSVLLLASVICLDIWSLSPSDSHSIFTLLVQYALSRVLPLVMSSSYTRFVQYCGDVRSAQDSFLLRVLHKNAKTSHGQKYKFDEVSSRMQFARNHPLTTYEDYQEDIERMCKGETDILTSDPLCLMALSSGTTGNCKKIPVTSSFRLQYMSDMGFILNLLAEHVTNLKRVITIRTKPKIKYTECGLPMHGTSHLFAPLPPHALTPRTAKNIEDEPLSMYITALFALAEREVCYMDAMLSPICYSFFKTIEKHADDLCTDLETGQLNDRLDVDRSLRDELNKCLKPDSARADEVRREIKKGNQGLALRLWPDIRLAAMNTTGAFAPHAKVLWETFLKGVFTKGFLHIASEGTVGVALADVNDCVKDVQQYVFTLQLLFLEFIPEEDIHKEKPRTYFLDQLERDKSYEVVLTNSCGLYRYRLGDVIKVVDFFHQCPVYEYQYRVGQFLNLSFEKVSENVFYEALVGAEAEWDGAQIQDYTATESVNVDLLKEYHKMEGDTNHYILFLEVTKGSSSYTLSEQETSLVERNLCNTDFGYNTFRQNDTIGPIEVIQVKEGTFQAVKLLIIKETNNQQYKTPRAMRRSDVLSFLLKNDQRLITSCENNNES